MDLILESDPATPRRRESSSIAPPGALAAAVLSALLVLLGGLPLRAAIPTPAPAIVPDAQYVITQWHAEHGLPDETVSSIVQTEDGYLWFGTFNGLVRFDGLAFQVFNVLNLPALPSNGIVNLHLDREGSLWVSTTAGLVRRKRGDWQRFDSSHGWAGNYVRWFAESPRGELYIATFDGEILRFGQGRFTRLPLPGKPQGGAGLWIDPQGRLNALRKGIWFRRQGAGWETVEVPSWDLSRARKWTPAGSGGFWLLDADRLLRIAEGRVVAERRLSRTPKDVWSMHEDQAGTVWICTDGDGLYALKKGGAERRFGQAQGFTTSAFRAVFMDRDGNLWIGSGGDGLARLRGRRFTAFGTAEGLPQSPIRSVAPSEEGVYVATYGAGLYRIAPDGRAAPVQPPLPQRHLHSVIKDGRGRLWVGTLDNGLFWLDRGTSRWQSLPALNGSSIEGLIEDSGGKVWVSSNRGAWMYDGAVFHQFSLDTAAGTAAMRCIQEGIGRGEVWAGGEEGLFRLEGSTFRPVRDARGVPLPAITAIHPAPAGLWLGSITHGLMFWRSRDSALFTLGNKLEHVNASEILERDDWLWLPSNHGIFRVRENELLKALQEPQYELSYQYFGQADGLPSELCPLWNQPAAAQDEAGRLWFATLRGVAMVDPESLAARAAPIPVIFESVSYFAGARFDRQKTLPAAADFAIPPGSRNIRIRFSALNPGSPYPVLFSFSLLREGQEITSGRQSERELEFLQLDPGRYQLRVRARNSDGIWADQPQFLAFEMEHFYYETPAFRILLGILGLGAVVAASSWRSRRKLDRAMEGLRHKEAVAELSARLALVLENTNDAVIFQAPDGGITYLNEAARNLLQFPAHLFPGSFSAADLYMPDFVSSHLPQALKEVQETGRWQGLGDFRCFCGGRIPVWLSMVAHPGSASAPGFVSIHARDMTGILEAQEALRISEEKFSQAFHVSPDAMAIVQLRDLRILEVNGSFVALFGCSAARAQATRLTDLDLCAGGDDVLGWTEEVQRTGRMPWRECSISRADSVPGTALCAIEPIPLGSEPACLLVIRDMTERQRLQQAIHQAQKMESIGVLAGGIAHDFNNQLTVIHGNVDRMLKDRSLSPFLREKLDTILKAASQAAFLTRQLLVFSRQHVSQARSIQLNQVIEESAAMIRSLVAEQVTVDIRLDPHLAPILADPSQIHQVILNLALNARDAMPQGGILRFGTASLAPDSLLLRSVSDAPPGPCVLLEVTDSGTGMSKETAARIFEPFYTTKEPGKGTGLGLSTVYGIVREAKGAIHVESELGAGSCFRLFFPAHDQPPDPETPPLEIAPANESVGTLLLVEDEEAIREFATAMLEEEGYRVLSASNGDDALLEYRRLDTPIDLLITDVIMPGMGGPELVRLLRREQPELRVLFVSGFSDDTLAPHGVLEEDVHYLSKPFRAAALVAKVRQVLQSVARDLR